MVEPRREDGLIPLTEPYTSLGFSLSSGGGESIASSILEVIGDNAIVDWVLVELKDKIDNTSVVLSKAALIQRDGDIVGLNGVDAPDLSSVPIDDYYLVIKHRNHLAVMTDSPIDINSGLEIDFRDLSFSAYGLNAQNITDGKHVFWAGDANVNGKISYNGSSNDKNSILAQVGLTTPNELEFGYYNNDVNLDGKVSYNGATNDKNTILSQVGLITPNNIIEEQLP